MLAYHDNEWGTPVADDRALFERLALEGFQAGLAWVTILRKREAFRRAFAGFDPVLVADFDDADRARLLATRASSATEPRSTPRSATPVHMWRWSPSTAASMSF
jgi:DNA-3-methyladenine glycosylase I